MASFQCLQIHVPEIKALLAFSPDPLTQIGPEPLLARATVFLATRWAMRWRFEVHRLTGLSGLRADPAQTSKVVGAAFVEIGVVHPDG